MSGEKSHTHSGHRQRMRDRYRIMGLDGFAPHEALEFILFYAIPRRDVNPLAHRLIDEFGTLDAVLSADAKELTKVEGVGESTAKFLNQMGECCELYASYCDNRLDLSRYKRIENYLKQILGEVKGLNTWAVCLDKMGRLVGAGVVGHSGWGEKDVIINTLKLVMKDHASTLVLIDERRPGETAITALDAEVSMDLAMDVGGLGVLIIDFIIAADGEMVSLRKNKVYDPTVGLKEGNESLVRLFTDWLD